MVTKVEPNIGHGISGWKKRQELSRKRMSSHSEERAEIRRIRKEHRLGLEGIAEVAEQPPQAVSGEVEIIQHPGGWYTVEVGGLRLHDSKMRKAEAEAFAEGYTNDEA